MQTKDFDAVEVEDYAVVVEKLPEPNQEYLKDGEIYVEHTQVNPDRYSLFVFNKLEDDVIENCFRIIATIAPKCIEGLPMVQLPDEDITKAIIQKVDDVLALHDKFIAMHPDKEDEDETDLKTSIMAGLWDAYNMGKEAQIKGAFSEEDLEDFFNEGWDLAVSGDYPLQNRDVAFKKHLQSLKKKPFPVRVTLEMKAIKNYGAVDCGDHDTWDTTVGWKIKIHQPDEHGGIIHPVNVIYEKIL